MQAAKVPLQDAVNHFGKPKQLNRNAKTVSLNAVGGSHILVLDIGFSQDIPILDMISRKHVVWIKESMKVFHEHHMDDQTPLRFNMCFINPKLVTSKNVATSSPHFLKL